MGTIEIDLPTEKIHDLLSSSDGMSHLLKEVLQQLIEAEMTAHLGAAHQDTRLTYLSHSAE